MPLAKIKVGNYADVDAAEGFSDYNGPTPPKGMYRCSVKWMKLVENSSGDPMFKVLFEIAEPQGSEKAKFNGYAIWHNANITQKGAPYLNAMLDALGLKRAAVYASKITLSDEKEDRVVKIGGKSVDGIEVLVTTQRREWPVGSDEWKLEAKSFSPAGAATVSTEKDADEDAGADEDGGDEDYSEPDADEPDEEDSF